MATIRLYSASGDYNGHDVDIVFFPASGGGPTTIATGVQLPYFWTTNYYFGTFDFIFHGDLEGKVCNLTIIEPTSTPTPTATEVEPTPTPTIPPPTPTPTVDCEFNVDIDVIYPTPTPTSTDIEPTPTPTATEIEPTPTATDVPPTPTATEVVPTPTPTPTSTIDCEFNVDIDIVYPTPTPTVSPTETPTPTPTATEVEPTPTATEIVPTPTSTDVPPPTETPTPTPTPTPEPECVDAFTATEVFNPSTVKLNYIVYELDTAADGNITDGSNTGQSLYKEVSVGTQLSVTGQTSPGTQFIGWNTSRDTISLLQTENILNHTALYDTTYYAIIDTNSIISKVICYSPNPDLNDICNNCNITKTIYFDKTDFETNGILNAIWYKDSSLTTFADNGYYRDPSITESPTIYLITNGVASLFDICNGDFIYCGVPQ